MLIHLLLTCFWKAFQDEMECKEMFSNKALANWIYVIIHVEKTFRAVKCQMFGNIFGYQVKIREHLQKKMYFFGFIL